MKQQKQLSLYLLFAILLSVGFSSCKNVKILRNQCFSEINMLKEQVLVVQLNSAHKKIAFLKSTNEIEEANAIAKKIEEENKEIKQSFKTHFDFCKVYFVESADAKKLRKQQYESIILTDCNNQKIKNPTFLKKGYLVATFDKLYSEQFVSENQNNARHSLGGTKTFPALIVLDKDYIQLQKPFPFKVITTEHHEYKDSVIILNEKLLAFHNKYQKKQAREKRKEQRRETKRLKRESKNK